MGKAIPSDWAELIAELASEDQRDWTALEVDDQRISIKELWQAVRSAATAFAAGSGPIAISHSNLIDHTIAAIGAVAAGRPAMMVDTKVPDALLTEVAARAGAGTAVGRKIDGIEFVSDEELRLGPPATIAPVDSKAPGSIFLTSGSTGTPKLVERSRGADLNAAMCLRLANFPIDPGDRHWLCVPHASASFLTLVMGALFARATLVSGQYDAAGAGRFLAAKQISSAYLVPTMLRLAREQDGLQGSGWEGMRCLMIGGEKLDAPTAEILLSLFDGRVYLAYGMTEIPRPTEATFEEMAARPGTVGRAIPFRRVRVVSPGTEDGVATGAEGEIQVTGPDLFDGYLGQERAGDWHRTGDFGHLDEDGYLYLTGRAGSVVQIGGNRVSTDEVAAELRRHPAVAQVAVIAVPDPVWTTRIEGFVVAEPEEQVDPEELRAWMKDRQPAYKVPRVFHLLEAIPTDGSGKLSLRRLEQISAERSPAAS